MDSRIRCAPSVRPIASERRCLLQISAADPFDDKIRDFLEHLISEETSASEEALAPAQSNAHESSGNESALDHVPHSAVTATPPTAGNVATAPVYTIADNTVDYNGPDWVWRFSVGPIVTPAD